MPPARRKSKGSRIIGTGTVSYAENLFRKWFNKYEPGLARTIPDVKTQAWVRALLASAFWAGRRDGLVSIEDSVEAFQKKFGFPLAEEPEWNATMLEERGVHLAEEMNEFADAVEAKDLPGVVDSLIDWMYVAYGLLRCLGVRDVYDIFMGVHRANMRKVRPKSSKESKRGFALDAVKPAGWKPYDVAEALKERGWGSQDPSLCHACNGSGEGPADGTVCKTCKGNGEISG